MPFDLWSIIGPLVTLFLAGVGFVIWCGRLEGRVNTAEKATAELSKDVDAGLQAHRLEITEIRAKATADAAAHGETTLALVRVQEQLKHLTNLVERLLEPAARRRQQPNE